MDYITVNEDFENSIEIKKSTFIAYLFPVKSADEANEYIDMIKKEHYKARHNCYAYVLGENMETKKASDDGEPAGTAGKPILSSIEQAGLTDVLIVVTRYFGGIKLGASGLIRAYAGAAGDVIKKADLVKKVSSITFVIDYDYSLHGKVETYLRSEDYRLKEPEFTDRIKYQVFVPEGMKDKFIDDITALTNARAGISAGETLYVDKYL